MSRQECTCPRCEHNEVDEKDTHAAAIARHLENNRAAIMREAREFAARNLCPMADAIQAIAEGYREGYYEEMADRRAGDHE